MAKIIKNNVVYTQVPATASGVAYDGTASGISAVTVQGAIDDVVSEKADRVSEPAEYDPTDTYAVGDFCTHDGNIYQATSNATGTWDYSVWELCTPQQDYLHSINPVGSGSFSLNRKSGTTIGPRSFATGQEITASGGASHAEGGWTTASGSYSHAEGFYAVASGLYSSHAEGINTTASGGYGSHAEGYYTTASGYYSHAEGKYTTANHKSQHTFGEFNILDDSTAQSSARGNYVEIVGNGTSNSARSNARTLDWSGNEVLAGGLKLNGTEDVITTSKSASSGGTDLSLVTTGEKYSWNNKADASDFVTSAVVTPTLNGVSTSTGAGEVCKYWKSGKVVTITFDIIIATTSSATTIFTLRQGYMPPEQITFVASAFTSSATAALRYCQIYANGNVVIYSQDQSRLLFTVTFVAA